jgi:Membrane protein involved in the export of O-antigen and teichoic acid
MLLFKNKIMENTKVIKNIKLTNTQIFSGFFWRLAERCGSQGISFIVMLILARMLGPEEYGTVALVTVVINILQVFVDSGLGNALIQKKNADDIDFSTVFYFNCSVCLLIYVLLFFLAPFIAVFYHNDSLTNLIRVLSISVIISGVRNVQQAIIARGLLYQKFFLSTAWGTIISAIIGITMAYCDAGIWALVMQQLSNICVGTIVLWHIVPWRPHWVFSINRLRLLYTYAWKLLVSALLDTCCNNLQQLIVGKFYSPMDLAFFNQGKKFPEILVANIDTSINGVLLPVMSQEQDNKTRIKSMARRAIKVSSFLIWPLMVGTILVAEPLIRVLLTDKWVPMVPFLKIFCLYFALWPIHTVNLSSINAIGRSDIFLKLELVKKCVEFLILATTMYFEPISYSLWYFAGRTLSERL